MQWHKYTITLKHDHGRCHITTAASTITGAVRSVLAAERAPFRAIVRIRRGRRIL